MKKLLARIKKQLKLRLPMALPRTDEQFLVFSATISELADFPDNDSVRQSVAVMMQHLGPLETHKAPNFFVQSLIKAVVNQVAFNAIQDVKERAKRAKDEQTVEGTDTTLVQETR